MTLGGHNVSNGVAEALKYGRAVPEAEWKTTINEAVFEVKT